MTNLFSKEANVTLCANCPATFEGGKYARFCPKCRALRRRKKSAAPPYSEAEDLAIREVYNQHHGTKALAVLVKRLGRPRWSVQRRAQVLGACVVQRREGPWTAPELELLRNYAWMVPDRIVVHFRKAGFKRTITAIAVQRKRLALRATADGTSATGLAALLGIDPNTVLRWIHKGWLHARKVGRAERDAWFVPTDAFRRFLLANAEKVDLGKAERAGSKLWLLELLTGGAVGASASGLDLASAPTREEASEDLASHKAARRSLTEDVSVSVFGALRSAGKDLRWLARRVGLSESTLDGMLAGRTLLPVAVVASLAVELGCEARLDLTPSRPAIARAA